MNQHSRKPFEVAWTGEFAYYPMLEKLVDVVSDAAERLTALAEDYQLVPAVPATVVQGQLMLMERPASPTPQALLESEVAARESAPDAQDIIQKRIIADLRQRVAAYRNELDAAKRLLLYGMGQSSH